VRFRVREASPGACPAPALDAHPAPAPPSILSPHGDDGAASGRAASGRADAGQAPAALALGRLAVPLAQRQSPPLLPAGPGRAPRVSRAKSCWLVGCREERMATHRASLRRQRSQLDHDLPSAIRCAAASIDERRRVGQCGLASLLQHRVVRLTPHLLQRRVARVGAALQGHQRPVRQEQGVMGLRQLVL
jgi:hypothetical protein